MDLKKKIKFFDLSLLIKIFVKIKNWPLYLVDYFSFLNKDIIYNMKDGLKYIVRARSSDRGVLTAVCINDEYGVDKLKLPKNATVIDLGAHIGVFSVYISNHVSRVFSYEPVPQNYRLLSKNIKINNLTKKIKPFNYAVSDKKGKLRICLLDSNLSGNSIYPSSNKYTRKRYIKVPAVTLNQVFSDNNIKRCHLLKIDVEGAEYQILYNLPKKYFDKIDKIYLEYHDINRERCNHSYLEYFLKHKGYKVIVKRGLLFANKMVD